MWEEAYEAIRNEEYNQDANERASRQYDHNEHEPTTLERAQYTAENFREDEEQDIYERDDKMGAI